MALTSYAGLIEALSAWLDGSDLGGRESDLIALCEDELNARLGAALQQGAAIRPMIERSTITIDGEYVDLPDGATILPVSIEIDVDGRRRTVRFTSAGRLAERGAMWGVGADQAVPSHYAVSGGQLRFLPAPIVPVEAVFTRYSRVPPLSAEAVSNWVLASHRNAYLYGALAQAELFGWNDARMTSFAALFAQAVDGIVALYPAPADHAVLTHDLPLSRTVSGSWGETAFLSGEG
ncbi:phage adaptor protein [Rhizorhabdus sp. FW153]|uniref:phage adaptor protein n=1 Tax=Rhizorhabdus sp. FW153 TaxID=3400216 RepID=UPI003CF0034D